jgi:hypothetical protein
MVEFTNRETKIVHIMNTILNPELKDVPWEIKLRTIQSNLLVCAIEWNEDEILDIVEGIKATQKATIASAMKNLGKYGHLLKGMKKLGI